MFDIFTLQVEAKLQAEVSRVRRALLDAELEIQKKDRVVAELSRKASDLEATSW